MVSELCSSAVESVSWRSIATRKENERGRKRKKWKKGKELCLISFLVKTSSVSLVLLWLSFAPRSPFLAQMQSWISFWSLPKTAQSCSSIDFFPKRRSQRHVSPHLTLIRVTQLVNPSATISHWGLQLNISGFLHMIPWENQKRYCLPWPFWQETPSMNVAILLISFCRSFVTMDSMISPLPRTSLLQQKKNN